MASVVKAYLDTPSGQLHYRHLGPKNGFSNLRPMLLLHMSASSSRSMEKLMTRYSDIGYDCFAPDYPGFGLSYKPTTNPPNTKWYVEVLVDFCKAIGIFDAKIGLHVLGHHSGACLAVEMAYLYPDVLRSVCLVGPALMSSEERATMKLRFFDPFNKPVADGSHLLKTWEYLKHLGIGNDLELHQREALDTMAAWEGRNQIYGCIWEQDCMAMFKKVKVPLLCMVALDDVLYPFFHYVSELRPDVETKELVGGDFEPDNDVDGIIKKHAPFLGEVERKLPKPPKKKSTVFASLFSILSIITAVVAFLATQTTTSNVLLSKLGLQSDQFPVSLGQPLINSIPPQLVDRFDPLFVKYYNRFHAGRLNIISPIQFPRNKLLADPTKYVITYGKESVPAVNKTTDYQVPVKNGEITVRIYEPPVVGPESRPVYVNYHGGGFMYGNLHFDEDFCKRIVHELGIVVVDVDYRLTPEFPFPTPMEDSWAAFHWVRSQASELNLDLSRIAIGGQSAGGNIAAHISQVCRDLSIPLAFQFLAVPWLDMDVFLPNSTLCPNCPYPSYFEFQDVVLIPAESMSFFIDGYLGSPRPASLWNHPTVSPIKAKNLSGIAPTLIITAELDVLRDEGELYGELLKNQGTEVQMIRVNGVGHLFMLFDAILEGGKLHNREAIKAIGKGLGILS